MLEALGFKPGQRGKRSVSCVRDRVNECYEKYKKSTQEAIRLGILLKGNIFRTFQKRKEKEKKLRNFIDVDVFCWTSTQYDLCKL